MAITYNDDDGDDDEDGDGDDEGDGDGEVMDGGYSMGDGAEIIGGEDVIGDGPGGLITGPGVGEITGEDNGDGDGDGDVIDDIDVVMLLLPPREDNGDVIDDVDIVMLLLPPLLLPGESIDIGKNGKIFIEPALPTDNRLFNSLCAFCTTSQSISFGSQSLGIIPLSSNSLLSCSYNALKSLLSFRSAANLSKVRKSCASLNL